MQGFPQSVCLRRIMSREVFNEALLAKVKEFAPDLIVLAGFLVKIPETMVHEYSNRIINIHPSLIPSSVVWDTMDFMCMKKHWSAV